MTCKKTVEYAQNVVSLRPRNMVNKVVGKDTDVKDVSSPFNLQRETCRCLVGPEVLTSPSATSPPHAEAWGSFYLPSPATLIVSHQAFAHETIFHGRPSTRSNEQSNPQHLYDPPYPKEGSMPRTRAPRTVSEHLESELIDLSYCISGIRETSDHLKTELARIEYIPLTH
jgi:hypothetical protein